MTPAQYAILPSSQIWELDRRANALTQLRLGACRSFGSFLQGRTHARARARACESNLASILPSSQVSLYVVDRLRPSDKNAFPLSSQDPPIILPRIRLGEFPLSVLHRWAAHFFGSFLRSILCGRQTRGSSLVNLNFHKVDEVDAPPPQLTRLYKRIPRAVDGAVDSHVGRSTWEHQPSFGNLRDSCGGGECGARGETAPPDHHRERAMA
jgi:hypothetical protein